MKKNIFIVDDDSSISEAISIILEDVDYTTTRLSTGKELFTELVSSKPSVILLDILLDRELGTDITAKLKSMTEYSSVPVILMSANPIDHEILIECGANAFLKKPFDMFELIDLVGKHA